MQSRKHIYILIGPKGSGKTYIGALIDHQLHIPFLRVEDIALQVKKERQYHDVDYIQEVFQSIEMTVRKILVTEDEVMFESIGLTDAFDQMLLRLKRDFRVTLIQIQTDLEKSLNRVKTRNQSEHVNVSDEHVMAINRQAVSKTFAFDGVIDNNKATAEEIIHAFEAIRSSTVRGQQQG